MPVTERPGQPANDTFYLYR